MVNRRQRGAWLVGLAGVGLILVLGGWSRQLAGAGIGTPSAASAGRPVLPVARPTPALMAGTMAGFGPVMANVGWLRSYFAWERRDAPAALRFAAEAVWADPQGWFFWSNGARMLAYDFPRWELAERGLRPDLAPAEWARTQSVFGQAAIGWLEQARPHFPEDPRVDLECARIALTVLKDGRRAAAYFRAAWEQPGGPYFAARVHAELLRAEGEEEAALRWYQDLLPRLPAEDPAAGRAIVAERIEQLTRRLEPQPASDDAP